MVDIEGSTASGFGDQSNHDLDQYLNFHQPDGLAAQNPDGVNDMYLFRSGLTPNGMDIDGGVTQTAFEDNNLFPPGPSQSLLQYGLHSGFPFPQINPATIMGPPQSLTGLHDSVLQNLSNGKGNPGGMTYSQASEKPQEVQVSKPKRTRRSKKKQLSQDEQDRKRKEFLERNRVAASKCRLRKQEATTALQERAQEYNLRNGQMREEIEVLSAQVTELSSLLLRHSTCNHPGLETSLFEHYRSVTQRGAGGGLGDSCSSARPGSSHSYGSLNSCTIGSPNHDEWMGEQGMTMSRQSSKRSSISEASGSGNERSGYTSAITTPENSTTEFSGSANSSAPPTRRGVPQKLLENPLCSTRPKTSLPGVLPSEFLVQQR